MSKITNDGLTQSDTGCFIAVHNGNSGHQEVKGGFQRCCYQFDRPSIRGVGVYSRGGD